MVLGDDGPAQELARLQAGQVAMGMAAFLRSCLPIT